MIYGDFETRSVVDLMKYGATRYAMDPATQVLCLCWSFDDDDTVHTWNRSHPWIDAAPRPDELLARIADGEPFEAHNAKFEWLIWNNVLMREFPDLFDVPLTIEQMICSAARASCLSLPRSLGEALIAIGAPPEFLKDTDGKRLINKLSKPMRKTKKIIAANKLTGADTGPLFCEEEIEHRRNWAYCGQDIRAERYLSHFVGDAMTDRERDYWLMDFRMNVRGVALDYPAVKVAVDLCEKETARLNGELFHITGGRVDKGSKRAAFKSWVNEKLGNLGESGIPDTRADTLSFQLYGVPTKASDEAKAALKPAMEERWTNFGDGGAAVKRAMEICLEVNKSSTAKFRQMEGSVCPDGRLHDIMLYNGADRTGRWSGQGVQPHNFVRGYSKDMAPHVIKDKKTGFEELRPGVWESILTGDLDFITLVEGPALPVLAKACRGALIASHGKELYAADFSAIEARKLAWMAGCASQLTLFLNKGDPYIDMACGIYKIECDATDPDAIDWFKKEHGDKRQMGKKAVLGLGYAMGWEKFQTTVYNEEGVWLDDEFCQMVVSVYRKQKCPEVPALWKATEKAAIAAVCEGGEWSAGGDPITGDGAISYFMRDRFLHCRLPSGRLLAYLDPIVKLKNNWRFTATNVQGKPCIVSFPAKIGVPMNRVYWHAKQLAEKQRKELTSDAPECFIGKHLSFMGRDTYTKQWKRCGTHGGSLVENADQASSRDLLAEAMWRIDQDARFALLLSIHDEVVAEAPIGTATVAEFEALMSEVPRWAPGMPIAAEGWIGPRLRK